jgi:hypothetical protein
MRCAALTSARERCAAHALDGDDDRTQNRRPMSDSISTVNQTDEDRPSRSPKPREQSGSQRTLQLAKLIGVPPRDLAHRVRGSRCALCAATIPFMRRYGEKKHYCASCEPGIDAETREAIDLLEQYL